MAAKGKAAKRSMPAYRVLDLTAEVVQLFSMLAPTQKIIVLEFLRTYSTPRKKGQVPCSGDVKIPVRIAAGTA